MKRIVLSTITKTVENMLNSAINASSLILSITSFAITAIACGLLIINKYVFSKKVRTNVLNKEIKKREKKFETFDGNLKNVLNALYLIEKFEHKYSSFTGNGMNLVLMLF